MILPLGSFVFHDGAHIQDTYQLLVRDFKRYPGNFSLSVLLIRELFQELPAM